MPPEINTIIMIGVGVLIGCLTMSNLSLRARVRHLEEQIDNLTRALGFGVSYGYGARLGGSRGEDREHGSPGGSGGGGNPSA